MIHIPNCWLFNTMVCNCVKQDCGIINLLMQILTGLILVLVIFQTRVVYQQLINIIKTII